jgi:hypothetical protein
MERVVQKIKFLSDEIKKMELFFYKSHDINIVMEEDAIDYLIEQVINTGSSIDHFYKKLNLDFEFGLKLVRERTGKNRFFITREALNRPEVFIASLLKSAD